MTLLKRALLATSIWLSLSIAAPIQAQPDPRYSPDDVRQGSHGTCPFISAVACAAQQRPEFLDELLERNEDGTVTVTLPGRDPVTVEIEGNNYSGANSTWWVEALEKAYRHHVWMDAGYTSGKGIDYLTGNPVDVDILSLTSLDTTRRKLEEAFNNDALVVAGRNNHIDLFDSYSHIPDGHFYSVLGYDRETDTVTLRNPWGLSGSGNEFHDTFELSLEEFDQAFTGIAYEERPAAETPVEDTEDETTANTIQPWGGHLILERIRHEEAAEEAEVPNVHNRVFIQLDIPLGESHDDTWTSDFYRETADAYGRWADEDEARARDLESREPLVPGGEEERLLNELAEAARERARHNREQQERYNQLAE